MILGFDFGTCFSHIQCMVGNTPMALIATNIYMGKPSEYLHGVGNGYDFTPYEKFANSGKLIKDLKPKLRNNGANYKDEEVDGAPTIGEIVKGFLCYYVDEQKEEFKKLNKRSLAYKDIEEDIEDALPNSLLSNPSYHSAPEYKRSLFMKICVLPSVNSSEGYSFTSKDSPLICSMMFIALFVLLSRLPGT